jgi:hypothetical protein
MIIIDDLNQSRVLSSVWLALLCLLVGSALQRSFSLRLVCLFVFFGVKWWKKHHRSFYYPPANKQGPPPKLCNCSPALTSNKLSFHMTFIRRKI